MGVQQDSIRNTQMYALSLFLFINALILGLAWVFWYILLNSVLEFIFRSNNGDKIPNSPIKSSAIDKQFLAAPIKSAVDKFQLLPEFLKVCQLEVLLIYF